MAKYRYLLLSNIIFSTTFISSCAFINNEYQDDIKIQKVIDGDTYKTNDNQIIRLLGADTPETYNKNNNFQSTTGKQLFYGEWAKSAIKKMIEGNFVTLLKIKKDKYHRNVAKVMYKNQDIASFLIKNGLALVRYIDNNKKSPFYYYDSYYINNLWKLQNNAKKEKNGFWIENKDALNEIFPGYKIT